MKQDVDVVVIGAGAAGVMCAKTLQDAGKSVVVLEAQDYIGGRTKSTSYQDVVAEEGAEFVHGEDALTWDCVRDFGLHTSEWQYDKQGSHRFFGADGQLREDGPELLAAMRQAEEGLYDYSGEDMSLAEFIDAKDAPEEAKFYAKRHIGDIEAVDAELLGLTGYVKASNAAINGSKNFWIHEGYSSLIQKLATGIDIRLEHPVKKIFWDDNDVTVECVAGQTLRAKKIVMTVSIGVLHGRGIEFVPALPDTFYKAVDKIGFGNSTKLVFWMDGPVTPFRMIDTAGLFGHFWLRDFGKLPVIVGFSGGSRADTLAGLSEEEAIARGTDELCSALGEGIRSQILHARHFTWSSNPYVIGSYSYPTVNIKDARAEIAQPIGDTIFYAGEATHSKGHAATVHGALEEGARAAKQILGII